MIDNEMNQTDPNQAAEQELNLVHDIFRTLAKTVKTFNVYPKDNPIYKKFATELYDKFSLFFKSCDELDIEVQQYSLLYKENEIYRSEERSNNIALLLFSDGLRKISFRKEITADEITDFIEILRMAPKSDAGDDDDIVTLLWEKNIRNMSYTAIEDTIDDDLAVEQELLREGFDDGISRHISSESGSLAEPGAHVFVGETCHYRLTEEDQTAYLNEISEINEDALLSSAADLFFNLLSCEQDTEAFPDMLQNIGRIMELKVKRNEIQAAVGILRRLKEVSDLCSLPGERELIDRLMSRAGAVENLKILFDGASDSEEIRSYLSFLGPESLRSMIQLLSELQDRKQRRLLCEILAEMSGQHTDTLAEALDDERWYLVRNIVMVLGMTKESAAIKHLGRTLHHKDARVRRETIRAVEGIASMESKPLLLAALADEDLNVRIAALKGLRRLKDPVTFESVKRYTSLEDLRKKSFAEKKELLETLAVLGGERAFPLLAELFRKRGFLEKEEVTEVRAAAAYGLGTLKSREAIALIEMEMDSKKELLRDACRKILRGA